MVFLKQKRDIGMFLKF